MPATGNNKSQPIDEENWQDSQLICWMTSNFFLTIIQPIFNWCYLDWSTVFLAEVFFFFSEFFGISTFLILRHGRTHLHPNGDHGSNGTNQQHSLTFCLCFAPAHLFGTLEWGDDLREEGSQVTRDGIKNFQFWMFRKETVGESRIFVFTRLLDHRVLERLLWYLFWFRCLGR